MGEKAPSELSNVNLAARAVDADDREKLLQLQATAMNAIAMAHGLAGRGAVFNAADMQDFHAISGLLSKRLGR